MQKSKTTLSSNLLAPLRGIPVEIVVASSLEDYIAYLERVAARSEALGVRFRRRDDDLYTFELRRREAGQTHTVTVVKGYLKRVDQWSTLVSGKSDLCIQCIATLVIIGSVIALGMLVWLFTGARGAMPVCAGIGLAGLAVMWVINVAVYQDRVRRMVYTLNPD